MTNRRTFLQQSGAVAFTSLLLPGIGRTATFFEGKAKTPVGLQLYTLGNLMSTDAKGTLQN